MCNIEKLGIGLGPKLVKYSHNLLSHAQGAIVEDFFARFKEFRRPTRDRQKQDPENTAQHQQQQHSMKMPASSLMEVPPFPPGEDKVSMERSISILKSEFSKRTRNAQLVHSYMEKTYPVRRQDILSGEKNLQTLLQTYPFLQDAEQVINYDAHNNIVTIMSFVALLQFYLDMERILKDTGVTRISVSDSWLKIWTPRIFKQATVESRSNAKLKACMESVKEGIKINLKYSWMIFIINILFMQNLQPLHWYGYLSCCAILAMFQTVIS